MTGLFISLAVPIGLLLLGFLVGRFRERRHLAELDQREAAAAAVTVIDVAQVPPGFVGGNGALVMGEVVIAADYFKSFLAGLRNLIGGEVKAYQTMLSRARREARLRMIGEAQALGAQLIVNARFEWSEVGPRVPSAEIFCYGTAVTADRI